MGGQCYLSGSVRMSAQAMAHLLAEESEVQPLLREAINEGALYYSADDGQVVLDGVYVSWDGDSVIDQLAKSKDIQSIDEVEWRGEGHDGPLSDILVYFLAMDRWLVKGLSRPRISSREQVRLLGREAQ